MSQTNLTFLDGTEVCPVCKAKMRRFTFKKNAVSNVSTKTDWAAMKKITSWQEQTYGHGAGTMCMACYKKRQIRFWIVLGILLAAMIAAIVVGAVCSIQPLLIGGFLALGVFFAFSLSKSGQELYDVFKGMERYANPAQEFACRLVTEHADQFGRNDRVYVDKQ